MSTKVKSVKFAVLATLAMSFVALADRAVGQAYVETDITGAQTQIDVAHTTTFYVGITAPSSFGGGNFVMKRGVSAISDSVFSFYNGSSCSGSPIEQVIVTASSFTGIFAPVAHHFAVPINLSPGIYCAKITSSAPDVQSEALFIKGIENCTLLPAAQAPGATCGLSLPSTNLTIAKAAPSPGLVVGQQSTYALTITNTGTAAASTARIKDLLPTGLTYVSASGTNWTCSPSGQTITCDFAGGTIAASGGTSTVNIVVSTNAGTGGQSLTNYASIDPTGGTSPPTPGPGCSPTASCANVGSTVDNTKGRTEAIVRNFLAKRGDRIASSSMPLNRLMNRLSDDDPCQEGSLKDTGRAVLLDRVDLRDAPGGNGSSPSVMRRADVEDRLAAFSRNASTIADPTDSKWLHSADEDGSGHRPAQKIGITAIGNDDAGQLRFSASVMETNAMIDAVGSSKSSLKPARSCGERRQPRFDAWSDGSYEYFTYPNSSGHFNLLRVGIDYKAMPGLLLGIMAQYDNAEDKSNALGYVVRGSGWMYGPYAAIKLGTNAYFDGRLLWGTSSNEVAPLMTYVDEFASERFLAAGRLSGLLKWDRLSLAPSIEYVHFSEKSESFFSAAGVSISEQSVNINRIIAGPEIRYSMPMSESLVLDAHVSAKGIWDITPIVLQDIDGSEGKTNKSALNMRVDVGVTLSNDQGYSVGVGVGIEGGGGGRVYFAIGKRENPCPAKLMQELTRSPSIVFPICGWPSGGKETLFGTISC